MSQLNRQARPWVEFNASDKQHRKYYAEFQRAGNWGTVPVRFISKDVGTLNAAIQRDLLKFYTEKEFG